MQISKEQIVRFIRDRGDEETATKAEAELPDHLDSHDDEGLLARYGVQLDDVDDASVWGER